MTAGRPVTAGRPAGDAALLVDAAGRAAELAAAIRAAGLAGLLDVVPGAGTVLITTEPGSRDLGELARLVSGLPLAGDPASGGPVVEIPVVYDGADLAAVAALTGRTEAAVIAAHAAPVYTVGWMGFSPGFGYLTGLDPVLAAVPRLDRPRLSVPAGSVAIAGGLAAVYPAAAPGGWRLLGRTPATLWDPLRAPPALLAPGLRVRFRPVRHSASERAATGTAGSEFSFPGPALGGPAMATAPAAATGAPASEADVHDRGRLAADKAAAPPRSSQPLAVIEVLRPGPLATVQDLGRPGYGHLGVPSGGAADAASLRLANRLVGNADAAAGIEFTLGRARLRFLADSVAAVTGAPARLTVTRPGAVTGAAPGPGTGSDTGSAALELPFGTAVHLAAGSVLRLDAPAAGLRTYLAVSGGIGGPVTLGSRSADLLSGLGPAPLQPGDLIRPAAPAGTGAIAQARTGTGTGTGTGMPPPDGPAVLRVIPGPRADWFGAAAITVLTGAEYTVTADSNRAGLRLDGPAVTRSRAGELPSEGMATGSLQVPPDGMPILMLADHPVTGGYPVLAVVASADIGLAAQLRPGQRIRFAVAAPGQSAMPPASAGPLSR